MKTTKIALALGLALAASGSVPAMAAPCGVASTFTTIVTNAPSPRVAVVKRPTINHTWCQLTAKTNVYGCGSWNTASPQELNHQGIASSFTFLPALGGPWFGAARPTGAAPPTRGCHWTCPTCEISITQADGLPVELLDFSVK